MTQSIQNPYTNNRWLSVNLKSLLTVLRPRNASAIGMQSIGRHDLYCLRVSPSNAIPKVIAPYSTPHFVYATSSEQLVMSRVIRMNQDALIIRLLTVLCSGLMPGTWAVAASRATVPNPNVGASRAVLPMVFAWPMSDHRASFPRPISNLTMIAAGRILSCRKSYHLT